jgi:hypothetical protein
MQIVITPEGDIRCLYGETIDLTTLGLLEIRRASHVEPTTDGQWLADLSPLSGPVLGPFVCRSEALGGEAAWITKHWLLRS